MNLFLLQSAAHRARSRTRATFSGFLLSAILVFAGCGPSDIPDAGTAEDVGAADRAAASMEYFVAPDGSDDADGSRGRPFATLPRARTAARAVAPDMTEDIVINVRAGTYRLTEPFELTAADSGSNGHRVIYQAYGYGTKQQEDVLISGGRPVTGWTLYDARKNIWQAEVGGLLTRQLYVNGRRAPRASIPNTLDMHENAAGYTVYAFDQLSWSSPADIEFVYERTAQNHSHPRCGVSSIQINLIVMDQPCFRWYQGVEALSIGPNRAPTSFENSRSFLTEPGTFVLDTSASGSHVLYYIPRPGEDPGQTEVIAPVLELLAHGNGTAEAPVHDITFRGFTFSHATWLHPSTERGYVHYLGEIYENGDPGTYIRSPDARFTPGSLLFVHSDRITLEGNRFEKLGAMALEIRGSENVVRGNVITDTSSGGILVGHGQPETQFRLARGNVIDNNLIHDLGAEYFGATGIMATYTKDLVISHNQINGLPDRGIYVLQGVHSTGATIGGARLLNNLIFDVMLKLGDGGGIYTIDNQGDAEETSTYEAGTLIRGNVIRDTDSITRTVGDLRGIPINIGLYTDFASRWITLEDNVVYHVQHSAGGLSSPGRGQIQDLQYLRNFWVDEHPHWPATPPLNVKEEGNTVLPREGSEAACRAILACEAILDEAGLEPEYRHLLH